MLSITETPPRSAIARFGPSFGQRFLLTIDTEEEFDWHRPLSREGHGLRHVARLAEFQQFCEAEGVVPLYLIDWPIAHSPEAAEILRTPVATARAEVGIQLHPWVNPPFDEEVTQRNSFAGNLAPELETAKFRKLRDAIEDNFGIAPMIYRAGRYGVGPNTAAMLAENGVAIDTSVRARFDYSAAGGPDFHAHPVAPYWLDEAKTLLELPLTAVFWGLLRGQGSTLYPMLSGSPTLRSLMAHAGFLERIPLTPEGVTVEEAIHGIDIALDDGLPLLVLSFHSPSLEAGHTPYVRDEGGLELFYDWWRRVFAYLDQRRVAPTTVAEIMRAVVR